MIVIDGATMNHRYADDDTYTLTLTAEGVYGSDEASLEVVVEPEPPQIRLFVAERVGEGDSFRFATEVTDPGDDEIELSWDFGDGSPPQTGTYEELASVEHSYDDGRYSVTLTARDKDDELQATHTRKVSIGNTVDVTVTGAVNASIQTGQGPASLCVVPLGEGGCGFHFQYWDDANQSYLFLQNYANPIVEPRDYPMVGPDARKLELGAPVAEAIGMVSAGMRTEDYQMVQEFLKITECDPDKMAGSFASALSVFTGGIKGSGGIKGMGKKLLKSLPGAGLLGSGGGGGAPTGGAWGSQSGTLRITSIDQNRVEGTVQSQMVGGKGKSQGTVSVEGSFSAEFEEHTQPFLEMCNLGPFRIADRSPAPDAENVFFGDPDLWVSFTRPLDPASVTGDSVRLEAKNDQGEYGLVPTRKLVDSETNRIHLVPWIQMDPARDHRIIVEGGPGGVRSRGGEQLSGGDEWEMTTMVDLYRPLASGGEAVARRLSPSFQLHQARRWDTLRPVYADRRLGAATLLPTMSQAWDGQDPDNIFERVKCDTHQVVRNRGLVTGKTTAFRVYLHWRKNSHVKALQADTVRFVGKDKKPVPLSGYGHLPPYFKPKDDWTEVEIRQALHTANYFGWDADRSVRSITAEVDLKDSNGKIHTFKGDCPVWHWDAVSGESTATIPENAKLRIAIYTLPATDEWNPPSTQVMNTVNKFMNGSLEYLIQNYPVSGLDVPSIVKVVETSEQAPGGGIQLLAANTAEEAVAKANVPKAMFLRLHRTLKQLGRLKDADVHVGIYPEGLKDWKSHPDQTTDKTFQYGYNYTTQDDLGSFQTRMARVLLDNQRANGSSTLAHEIGHTLGLEHVDGNKCETHGFRLDLDGTGGKNKSSEEGNAEDKSLFSMMGTTTLPNEQQAFICDENYGSLTFCLSFLLQGEQPPSNHCW